MPETFNFAPDSHIAIEKAPEETSAVTFNGWEFTARPAVPYRRKFILKISGMYWRMGEGILDVTTDPPTNVGALLAFYRTHRRWKAFNYDHEYLGTIECKFADVVNVPEALPNSFGLVPEFEISLLHSNPAFE